ncbi:MAG: Glu-tRNA(Gln) amidotransferase subunit GatD [Nanoarchaeota archaeon]
MASSGDKVKVVTKDEIVEGVLMPNEETDSVVVKLDNGYNVGIDKKKVKKIELVEKNKEKTAKKEKITSNKNLPTISILHTGGTIASKVDYKTGGVVARFEPEELIEMFPELKQIANIKSRLVAKMFSEDIRFGHYQLMVKAIQEEIKSGVDGIILTHGTDTMTYTSAALAFALENLPVPVIMVGAQRSSDRGSSDAAVNLICAAEFIAKTDFSGVAICMHENMDDNNCVILPACKTRKLHASRRDAFKPVNDKIIAKVNFENKKIEFLKKDYNKKDKKRELIIKDDFEAKVSILRCHPNMVPKQFEFYEGYKGLVIEGTGLGQAPVGVPNELCEIHKKNLSAIKNLVKNGTVVVMTSQTIFGRVQMHVYSNAIDLANVGVLSGEDMLTETAFIKLAWLLGNYKNKEEAKRLIGVKLRGEINNTIEPDEYLD